MSPKEYDEALKAGVPSGSMDRRKFARTAAGLFVAASVLDACGDDGGPAMGTLTVDVVGLTGPVPLTGGSVLVTTTASGSFSFPTTLPVDGDESKPAPAGDYTIVYTPPTGYLLNGGDSNTKNVTVSAGGEGIATFNVVVAPAATGTIRVNVTGLAAGSVNGGSAAILRTDIGGQVALNVPIPAATGTADSVLAPGTYQVTYTVAAGHALNGGVTNPVTNIGLIADEVEIVAFAVTETTAAPNIYSHGFEDSTSGQLVNGSFQPIIGNSSWTLENGVAFRGTKSLKQTYTVSAGNVGAAFFHSLAVPRAALFCRFAYRQSDPFNTNGSASNADFAKIVRFYRPTLTGPFGTIIINPNNEYNIAIDGLVPNSGGPLAGQSFAPNVNFATRLRPNSRLGQWTIIEFFADYSVDGAVVMKCWINDILHHDLTLNVSNKQSGTDILAGWIQFDGTVNSMASADSTAWFDDIGFSTQKMGIPV